MFLMTLNSDKVRSLALIAAVSFLWRATEQKRFSGKQGAHFQIALRFRFKKIELSKRQVNALNYYQHKLPQPHH